MHVSDHHEMCKEMQDSLDATLTEVLQTGTEKAQGPECLKNHCEKLEDVYERTFRSLMRNMEQDMHCAKRGYVLARIGMSMSALFNSTQKS